MEKLAFDHASHEASEGLARRLRLENLRGGVTVS